VLEVGARRPLQRDDTLVEVLSQVGLQLARAYESELAQKEVREAQLRALESQKLEAVGRLAGGIAHDFNNLLMVVLGEAELALRDGAITPALRSSLEEIRASGQRAALLTARLLAFSRRDMVRAEKIDMCGVLRDAESVLQRVMGEDVHVSTRVDVAPGDCIVEGNRGLLEQVLMNLAVNAREAMPDGGEVEIRLGVTSLSTSTAAAAGSPGANQGRYVVLSVRDTGIGIPPENRDAIFEPFFSTKEDGSGFGLATSYGIVRAAGGVIEVESEVGAGSVFRVYLPVVPVGPERISAGVGGGEPEAQGEALGARRVLVVVDDDGVRSVAARILKLGGYRVTTARDRAGAESQAPTPAAVSIMSTTRAGTRTAFGVGTIR
jgi:signal transduction histidine kinase